MTKKRTRPNAIRRFWRTLGPGLITGASDDDPSGIATYSQAGAMFGLATLWTAVATYPLMVGVQEMCARIGIVTRQGLAGVLKRHYPRPLLYGMILFSVPAIIINIGADIQAMGAVTHMLFPRIPPHGASVFFTAILFVATVFLRYKTFARALKYLCLSLLLGLVFNFTSVSPIDALILAAMLYGLTAPVLIAMVLHISNNRKIMGAFANSGWSNFWGGAALLLMALSAGFLLYFMIK